MPDSKDRGLKGISRHFFEDSSEEKALMRRSATTLSDIRSGQAPLNATMGRVAGEIARHRSASEQALPMLSGIAAANMEMSGRLGELDESLNSGFSNVADAIQRAGDQAVGMPTEKRGINELLGQGLVDETELIILALRGLLDVDQSKKIFATLPDWKRAIVSSTLVARPDPRVERTLSPEESIFLADLRRKSSGPIEHMRSLNVVGRHGLLDTEMHHVLGQRIRELRAGLAGLGYSAQESLVQGDELISQGSVAIQQRDSATQQRGVAMQQREEAAWQRSTAIQQREGAAQQREVGIHQRDTALRLLNAGVYQRSELIGLSTASLDVQRGSLDTQRKALGVSESLLGVQQGAAVDLASLKGLAEDASVDRKAIVRNSEVLIETTSTTADNTGRTADAVSRYGELQARQMDRAQGARLAQLEQITRVADLAEIGNAVLGDMAESLGELVELDTSQLESLEWIQYGIDGLQEIGEAQLAVSKATNSRLEALHGLTARGFSVVGEVLLKIHESIQGIGGTIERLARDEDQIRGDEAVRRGLQWLSRGNIERTIVALDSAEERYDLDLRIFMNRALCHVFMDDAEKSEKDFLTALQLASGDENKRLRSLIRLNLGRLYASKAKVSLEEGDQQGHENSLLQAIEITGLAVSEDPEFLENKFYLAVYLAEYKLLEKSLKIIMEILAKDPKYSTKVRCHRELDPIRDSLVHVFSDLKLEVEGAGELSVKLNLARDAVLYGDIDFAIDVFSEICQTDGQFLLNSRFWEMEEFLLLKPQCYNAMVESITARKKKPPVHWYSLAICMLHMPNIIRGDIYEAFHRGALADKDFSNQKAAKITQNLKKLAGKKWESFRLIISTKRPIDFPWLNNEL